MKNCEQKIIQFVERYKLIKSGDNILIAFSGGPDSVFALHFFNKFRNKYKIQLMAVHFNHQLRGKEADKDELFCENFCEVNSIPYYSSKLDVKGFAKKNKISIEEAARKLRYKNLEEIAIDFNCTKIITAHNKSDNTETVLLNLSSGTGFSGISGIPVKRGKIIRPILCLTKSEILDYLKLNKIHFRIDSSNLSNDYKRNFIRNEIIPKLIGKINPQIDDAIFRTSKTLESFLPEFEKRINRFIKKYVTYFNNSAIINQKLFENETDGIIGEVLKNILQIKFNYEFKYRDFITIKELSQKHKGKRIHISSDIIAVKEIDTVNIIQNYLPVRNFNYRISPNKSIELNGKSFGIESAKKENVIYKHSGNIEFIDAENLSDIFILRRWKNGDKFVPLGMKSYKKVSDFLTDLKIPSTIKKEQLVLTNRNKIVWVVGLRIDDSVKIKKETKKVYKLWIE